MASFKTFYNSYGQHRPMCNGVCLVAHTGWENLTPVTFFMIAIPVVCWYYFLFEDMTDRISIVLAVAVGIEFGVSIFLLFATQLTEPGILPTITYEEYTEDDPDGPVRIVSRVVLNGREYELRQFRAKFSRFTGNCVESFDHYCPWVGNAIGKRNYRYFVLFMFSCLILTSTIAGSCTALLILKSVQEDISIAAAIERTISATLLGVYAYCMAVSLFSLCGFHLRAIAKNMTTNEILKDVYNSRNINPDDHGCYTNYGNFLFNPVPPSRVSGHEDDSSLYEEQLLGDLESLEQNI